MQSNSLITDEGLRLGNYVYAIVTYRRENIVYISLTRWYTECDGCPHADVCDFENPVVLNCQACSMMPLAPYSSTYDIEYDSLSRRFNELPCEFTVEEIIAIVYLIREELQNAVQS